MTTVDSRASDTIEAIEGVREPEPGPETTTVIRRCLALRRKPLSQFTTEDLRLMLGQQIAVPILLPLAVAVLAEDPLAEGDYYPGDLLYAVLRLPEPTWRSAARHRDRLVEVLRGMRLPNGAGAADLRRAIAVFVDDPQPDQPCPPPSRAPGAPDAFRRPSHGEP